MRKHLSLLLLILFSIAGYAQDVNSTWIIINQTPYPMDGYQMLVRAEIMCGTNRKSFDKVNESDFQKSNIRIYDDAAHPSKIILPLLNN